jgi:exodeoxyribonuclease V
VGDLHAMKQSLGKFQVVYARMVRTAQARRTPLMLLDVTDIGRRVRDNLLEAQQLCYVGATRPTTSPAVAGT